MQQYLNISCYVGTCPAYGVRDLPLVTGHQVCLDNHGCLPHGFLSPLQIKTSGEEEGDGLRVRNVLSPG